MELLLELWTHSAPARQPSSNGSNPSGVWESGIARARPERERERRPQRFWQATVWRKRDARHTSRAHTAVATKYAHFAKVWPARAQCGRGGF